MTAAKRILGERVVVDPLNSTVLGVLQHQTIKKSKMTLAFGRLLRFQVPTSNILKRACLYKNNHNNSYNGNNSKPMLAFFMTHNHSPLTDSNRG